MKVSLINYTSDAVNLLIYTKSTRLTQGEDTRKKIEALSDAEKAAELKYMSRSIPSSWEFVDYVFEIKDVTRAFTHQFVRTRTGSYAQQTHRMLDASGFTYMTPSKLKETATDEGERKAHLYHGAMNNIASAYKAMVDLGVAPEDARGILPTNIHTNIIAKFSLRTLSDLVRKRSSGRVQEEYRQVLEGMVREVLSVHPWAVDFLYPRGTGSFKAAEAFIAAHRDKDPKGAVEALKDIDLARKELG